MSISRKPAATVTPRPASEAINDADLSHLEDSQREEVQKMLEPFSNMWSGKLSLCKATEYKIVLVPGAQSHFQHPYRTGPERREIIESHLDELQKEGLIEPA